MEQPDFAPTTVTQMATGIFLAEFARYFAPQACGVIVTASHNPLEDNGLKIVERDGTHLRTACEQLIVQFATHSEDLQSSLDTLRIQLSQLLTNSKQIRSDGIQQSALVFVARDNRPSSERLIDLVQAGLNAFNAKIVNFGLATTPQVFYIVNKYNSDVLLSTDSTNNALQTEPTAMLMDKYYKQITEAVHTFARCLTTRDTSPTVLKQRGPIVCVDCANGVGAIALRRIVQAIENTFEENLQYFNFKLFNEGDVAALNFECGSEYVQTLGRKPTGCEEMHKLYLQCDRFCCLDGDADRIVQYNNQEITLFDGDRIMSLLAYFIHSQISAIKQLSSELALQELCTLFQSFTIGAVFTAYTNGGCEAFLKSHGFECRVAPTGVKNLYKIAVEYSIAVFFEYNGHGSILIDSAVQQTFERILYQLTSTRDQTSKRCEKLIHHLTLLLSYANAANQTTRGDAVADAILVELSLAYFGFSMRDWRALYSDYHSTTRKVVVADRFKIKTTYAEDEVLEPQSLRADIAQLLSEYPQAKAFVRASGTEDCVKVHVEAADKACVEQVASKLEALVRNNLDLAVLQAKQ